MKSFSIVLTGNRDSVCLLSKNGRIPSGEVEVETGVKLKKNEVFSKNIFGTKFYFTRNPQIPLNGWKWIPLINLERLEENYGALLCEALGKFWEVMPSFNKKLENIKLPSLFKKKEFSSEVIFFPGSFNPWHKGHLACLNLCPKKSKIIVVPDNNPWKHKGKETKDCKWEKYRNLCILLKDNPCSVFPGFLGLEKANPTINWFPKIKIKEKSLLMGDDSFLSLIKWKESKKLISTIQKIYVVPRIGRGEELYLMKKGLLAINPELKIKFLPSHDFQKISSTKIRGD